MAEDSSQDKKAASKTEASKSEAPKTDALKTEAPKADAPKSGDKPAENIPDRRKLFISNLDFEITEEKLREMFEESGALVSCVIATDRETKRSKGFAFVEMGSEDAADKAVSSLDNKVMNGRPMKVSFDRGKTGGGRGGSFGGGRGDGKPGGRRFEQLPPIQRMQLFRRKRKLDPFLEDPTKSIDYRDVATLSRFISERGKILSRRLTGLDAYNQRKIAKAIKRAQNLGLMTYRET